MADVTGTLTQIFTYPIKSCAGTALPEARLTSLGIEHDRQWLIVDDVGQFQTQRQIPHLAWIEPTVIGKSLQLSAPELPTISVNFATSDAKKLAVNIWNDRLLALDMGDMAAQWLDEFLEVPGRHFRLVQFDRKQSRFSDQTWCGDWPAALQFADGFAVNVLSEASLTHFNERLMEMGLDPVDARRFRPNLVIDGLEPHEEDQIGKLRLKAGDSHLELELVKPCPRCQIPDINPDTAIKETEITDALIRYRQLPSMDHAVCFAMNAVVRSKSAAILKLGMQYEADYRFKESH
ncbi:MAG: MOSC N-terminal beta barrel domain-containing protein [Burkholderiaceae bacterium]|nr:MOSC N-terminal beta barrel domain-containing protein [Burkholderiaceae bacterium]MCD8517509.1 MOSC N-terminal beta barrel domain-containing protein [Burkholderiaceae bacterium]MCD8537893.1 MOSC N-terminal beta barrel domain-containing protein [Burkholderiaceae bacterium]MCD8565911.1 MOSC N-terminal beta barrel domain-containing protein [Burkholderiaceae bacterium]